MNQNRNLSDMKCCAVLFAITYVIEAFIDSFNNALEALETENYRGNKNKNKDYTVAIGENGKKCHPQDNENEITDTDTCHRDINDKNNFDEINKSKNKCGSNENNNHDNLGSNNKFDKNRTVHHNCLSKAFYSFLPLFSILSLFSASLEKDEKFHFYRVKLLSISQGNFVRKFRSFCCENGNEDFTDLEDISEHGFDNVHQTDHNKKDLGSEK